MRRAPGPRSVDISEPDGREPPLPRSTRWLRPAVDAVARIRLSIHRKLLFGFLAVVLLLLGMATLSVVVIGQMNHRVEVLEEQAERVDMAERMYYDVTAQSHYRAMALLQYSHPSKDWNGKVIAKKKDFQSLLDQLEATDPGNDGFYKRLETANRRYEQASNAVVAAFELPDPKKARRLHLRSEHEASHVVEDLLATCDEPTADPCTPYSAPYISRAQDAMDRAAGDFESDRARLHNIVIGFSAASILVALLLGFLLSWAFVLPVKKMQHALAGMSAGRVRQRVEVANRDEFGTLSQDLNRTSERLSSSFERQRSLAARLGETNASLARASEAKSRFLASVSHELRTPMNAILGFTDALLAGVDGPLNDAQRESLGWVQRGGRDLLGLINEILDLSRIEAGRLVLDPQPIDARRLVSSVVEQQRPLADRKGLALRYRDAEAPGRAVLDAQRLRQIVVNVVGNAVKFTERGHVDVEVRGEGESLLVEVRDTGPGIALEHREAVFEEFGQVHDDVTGTGLGLAISRRLARAMDGDLTLESEPGTGSLFRLRLPLNRQPAASTPATDPPHPADARPHRLLLSVDDDPSVAPLLQKMLADEGYRVVGGQGPLAAVADAKRLQPDAILLDLVMEERAGEDVLRDLKSDPATRSVPVVIVSVVDAEDVPDLAEGRLAKPVDRAELVAALGGLDLGGVSR